MKYFQFHSLLLKEGWLSPAFVGVDDKGIIQYLLSNKPSNIEAVEMVHGTALPGFQNAHSHAFQYSMAGMAEQHATDASDDFWSWREAMYACAGSFSPEGMEKVATTLYSHLLRNGYTSVAEFHYLHHDGQGKQYSNPAEMGERLVAAAKTAGIKITLIPIFYQRGDFGKEPQLRQRRFIAATVDDYFKLLDKSKQAITYYEHAKLGFGVHSLRAVDAKNIITTYEEGPKKLPFHLHAAEQLGEVERCIEYLGKRPVEWLLDNLPLNSRFHLVHCTHMTSLETEQLAKSGANAVLCPGTEANLGDGIFPLKLFAGHGGNWSIGSDSHISLNPLEDLRWLDYAQRLTTYKRNTFADGASVLTEKAFFSGIKAMGSHAQNYFAIGQPLDAVVYDIMQPLLAQAEMKHLLSAIVYTADTSAVLGTLVNGNWMYKKQY
ncbi:formimidoylglutamate deiminase [Ilyomonas limi]|uniref:Formimidoylglutamate deiminase n=1 Tax=Ilyomonas limi TaxID=2575867 RepID=A0A4V5UV82_9BACT|nr:formimidoylglutamate deiminase [Ilyomonas limi]TKK66603.1 formimidoylglutamate deiminase [Ilyomonas limi]